MSDEYKTSPVGMVPGYGEYQRQRGEQHGAFPLSPHGHDPHHSHSHHHPAPHDEASVAGIPAHMLTPEVEHAVAALMAANEALRQENELGAQREKFLDDAAHRHTFLPTLNRRGLGREISRLAARRVNGGLGGALVVIHFGGIERLRLEQGMAAADAALLHIAGILGDGLRASDYVANLNGSDFGLFLALAAAGEAEAKVKQLVERINRPPWHWAGREVVCPARWGVALLEADSTVDALLAAADPVRR